VVNALKLINITFPRSKRYLWKAFYTILALSKKNQNIHFMNYGFTMKNPISLEKIDSNNLYRIQLYHRLIMNIDIKNKDILEVGCGRGGGCSYYSRYLKPNSVTGIDLSGLNINICKKSHKDITFQVGDAENIPFPDNHFDVLINLESSHCYPNFLKFMEESYRVLRNNSYLCFADFVITEDIDKIRKNMISAGFKIIEEVDLTENVLDAIIKDNELNKFKETNRIFNINLRKLTGADGSSERGLIPMFKNKSLVHIHFLLQK